MITPVMFPPGRDSLATSPNRTGSALVAMTIGTELVACLAAMAASPVAVTTMSTLIWINSAANAGSRAACPSAHRGSGKVVRIGLLDYSFANG